jgi:hypothetical protein
MKPAHPEIGRELAAAELKCGIVYVLVGDHKPGVALTMWHTWIIGGWAFFYAGETGMILLLMVNERGECHDALERRIRVYEYLGSAEK